MKTKFFIKYMVEKRFLISILNKNLLLITSGRKKMKHLLVHTYKLLKM